MTPVLENLELREQRWGLAIENAGFGVWDLDVLACTVHYSPEWKVMLGYGGDDTPDSTTTWRERVHVDDLQPMLLALGGHLSGAQPNYQIEFRVRAADGSYRWVHSRGRVVARDEAGAPRRAIGTMTDVSDRRNADARRLERDRATAEVRAETDFLSHMSHELRTPLNAMLGFAQLLKVDIGHTALDEQRARLGQIEQAGWQLLTLIETMFERSGIKPKPPAVPEGDTPFAMTPQQT